MSPHLDQYVNVKRQLGIRRLPLTLAAWLSYAGQITLFLQLT